MPNKIRFNVLDSKRNGKKGRPRDYYINGEGDIFYDCDPCGVDMSGKRTIRGADPNRFTTVEMENSTS